MPNFTVRGRAYHSAVEFALDKIGGRWKLPIIWRLKDRSWRYSELLANIQGITPKMLTQQLRELEADQLVHRKQYLEVPPRVEYSLTETGARVVPLIQELRKLGEYLLFQNQPPNC